MQTEIQHLIEETKRLLGARAGELDLSDRVIGSVRHVREIKPTSLPVVDLLESILPTASVETRPLAQAILDAAPQLAWRQTYTAEDGFDQAYLQRYGWFDLAGPEGPCDADDIRIMMGYWGEGLLYPNHSHPPEEHYLVLAGGAKFRLNDAPYLRHGPGEIFHTPAGAVHSADMRDEPLLAMSIWRAEDLSVRISLTDSDRGVAVP